MTHLQPVLLFKDSTRYKCELIAAQHDFRMHPRVAGSSIAGVAEG
ncbi:MAG TPA: hypothetical protein VGY91_09135 [Chthoniobacterales bacterium]|nr:hypothetical protein [Chthoniobacterales bacterium]